MTPPLRPLPLETKSLDDLRHLIRSRRVRDMKVSVVGEHHVFTYRLLYQPMARSCKVPRQAGSSIHVLALMALYRTHKSRSPEVRRGPGWNPHS